ncbi:MAG: GspH/FimT family pseudopilin [Burkholderiales bacterium]|jgi:type IV fimbrial biogenesis protein FimT|nr:GspH/FimT family pseudopilin [Burkholderiales bacterium]
MLTLRPPMRGFTLIELMVGLALLAFVLMLGVPSFGSFLQNQKLRDAGTTTLAAIQFARAEAIRLNSNVEFLMTTTEPDLGNFAGLAESTTGRNFLVRGNVYNPGTGTMDITMLEAKAEQEGSGTNAGTATGIELAATTGRVVFTPLGGTTLAADEVIQISNPAGGTCKASGGTMRCLNVVVTRGGQVRLCDPSVTTAGDTRRC